MQLAARVVGVVHAADAGAELEAQRAGRRAACWATSRRFSRRTWKVISPRWMTTSASQRSSRGRRPPRRTSRRRGAAAAPGEDDRRDQAAVPAGVAGAAWRRTCRYVDRPRWTSPGRGGERSPGDCSTAGCSGALSLVGHRSRPFISEVGSALRAAVSSSSICGGAVGAELGVLDLVVQLEDRVDQHLRARRAAGEVHVDRDDVVDALDDRVVVEHPAAAGADAHREHPLGVGHLVVDLAEHRRHLLADPAGHDHQVGLARAGPEDLHAEAGEVVLRAAAGHHLDRAAGQAERRRPEAGLAHVAGEALDGGEQDAARQLLFDAHVSPSPAVPSQQAAAAPDVGVGDEDGGDEDDHLDQPEELHRVELHGPRVEEDDLDVEDDEEHRGDVVLHREPAAADRLRGGLDAALVGVELRPVVALRADQRG